VLLQVFFILLCHPFFYNFVLVSSAEQTISLDLLSQPIVLNQVGTMWTFGQGLRPSRSILTWDPWGGPSKHRKGG